MTPTHESVHGKPVDRCETITQYNSQTWNEAIADTDPEFKFMGSDWMELLAKTYGYEPILIVFKRDQKIKAVLPIMVVRSMLTGTRGISLPFIDICRPYCDHESQLRMLYTELVQYGKSQKWDYLELRGSVEEMGASQSSLQFYNHVVNLSQGPTEIFRNMASSNQRAVRKAQKEDVLIQISDTVDSLKEFYRLQCLTRKRHGLPSQPYKFFKNLHQQFIEPGRGTIVSARTPTGVIASSAIYLEQGKRVHYKYGASDLKYQQARCNNLVMWSAMKHYSERGFQMLDLGRNSIENQGLRRYKQSWGGSESIVHYHRFDLKKNAAVEMRDEVFGWYNTIFKRLPNPMLQLAGRLLYRHIA